MRRREGLILPHHRLMLINIFYARSFIDSMVSGWRWRFYFYGWLEDGIVLGSYYYKFFVGENWCSFTQVCIYEMWTIWNMNTFGGGINLWEQQATALANGFASNVSLIVQLPEDNILDASLFSHMGGSQMYDVVNSFFALFWSSSSCFLIPFSLYESIAWKGEKRDKKNKSEMVRPHGICSYLESLFAVLFISPWVQMIWVPQRRSERCIYQQDKSHGNCAYHT